MVYIPDFGRLVKQSQCINMYKEQIITNLALYSKCTSQDIQRIYLPCLIKYVWMYSHVLENHVIMIL